MNRIQNEAQYLGEGKKFTEVPEFRDDVKCVEDRASTLALHRLHARTGFDLPGQSPRRRHEMEDQGYIR